VKSYPAGYINPESPIHPEPGVYILKNDELQITAQKSIGLNAGKHTLKIGTTGNFDTRRKTVNGENVNSSYRTDPYFGVTKWYLARFLSFDDAAQAAEYEKQVHSQLDELRVSLEQAARLSFDHKVEIWNKKTRPELFIMSLAEPLLLKLIPSDPGRAKRPRDFSANYSRKMQNEF